MNTKTQTHKNPTPNAGMFRKLTNAIFGANAHIRPTAVADIMEPSEPEQPIFVTAVYRNSCFVHIEYQGESMEAIDPRFGNGTGHTLDVGDEVVIVDYRSDWPVVRKAAKVISFPQHLPSNFRMSASI